MSITMSSPCLISRRLKKIMEEQAAQPPRPSVEIADESGTKQNCLLLRV